MLKIEKLHGGYDKIEILKGLSLSVTSGQIVALIGSNGTGKSTLLMTLSGIVRAWSGSITFEGQELLKLSPDVIVRRGLVQAPEGRRVFQHLTVSENLDLGAYSRSDHTQIKTDKAEMLELFPILKDRLNGLAGNLSGGEQQMLAMARALMAKPKLLLLDEPSLGLAPLLIEKVFGLIQRIKERGVTILLVEQNAYKALGIADYGYVMEGGQIELEGKGSALLHDPKIKAAYLGM